MPYTFPYPPDWSDPPSESIEYPTQVLETWDRHEQRISLRAIPIHRWEYAPDPSMFAAMLTQIRAAHGSTIYAPMWHRSAVLGTELAIGGSTAYATTTGRGFKTGDYVAIWTPGKNVAMYAVSGVNAAYVTFSGTASVVYPVGSLVAPAPAALLDLSVGDFSQIVPGAAPSRVRFRAISDTRLSLSYSSTYNSRLIQPTRPNVANPPSFRQEKTGWDIGSTPNIITRRTVDANPSSRQYTWSTETIADITDWLKFFETVKGRLTPFYLPTWSADWTEGDTAGQGRNFVCAVTYSGTFTANVTALWSRVSNALNMFLPLVRLSDDVVSISYRTLTQAEISLNVQDLRHEA